SVPLVPPRVGQSRTAAWREESSRPRVPPACLHLRICESRDRVERCRENPLQIAVPSSLPHHERRCRLHCGNADRQSSSCSPPYRRCPLSSGGTSRSPYAHPATKRLMAWKRQLRRRAERCESATKQRHLCREEDRRLNNQAGPTRPSL